MSRGVLARVEKAVRDWAGGPLRPRAETRLKLPRCLMTQPPPTPTPCPILHLDLGPLDLNLLGLHVHLNEVVLNVEAIPGAGNLLGNLLCAIAGLLDNVDLSGVLGN